MRVAIDVLLAERNPGGMLFAAQSLLSGLAQTDDGNEYIVLTSQPQDYEHLAATSHMRVHVVRPRSWRGSLLRHQALMLPVLRQVRPDILHVPAFAAPLAWRGPLVLTVHDLAFLADAGRPSLYARLYWQHVLRHSVQRAQRIVVVSDQTRDELLSRWSVDAERIRVIPNALRPTLRHAPGSLGPTDASVPSDLAGHLEGARYLLHVGRIIPRKNVESLVRAFGTLAARHPDLHLVLTGGVGFGGESAMREIAESPAHDRIHLLGWVSDGQLADLYARASAVVVPSLHEGFCLPIVEAMAHGTPVVASPAAAAPGVGGDAILRASGTDAGALASAIDDVLTDADLRERLSGLGRTRTEAFSARACAAATREVYAEAAHLTRRPLTIRTAPVALRPPSHTSA